VHDLIVLWLGPCDHSFEHAQPDPHRGERGYRRHGGRTARLQVMPRDMADVPGDGCAQAEQRRGPGPASWVEQRIGGRPINSDSSPATLAVKYLRIWSYR
jgi:hypothetical protein